MPERSNAALATTTAASERGERLSLRLCIGYGVGDIPVAILAASFGFIILRFMTDVLGVAASVAGLLIALSKLYDTVADPVMGAISDRFHSAIGRRRPFLVLGAMLAAGALVAMFNLPALGTPLLRLAYVCGALLLYTTAYTVWQVPYMAIAAEMTESYHERSRIMAYMLYGGMAGQILLGVCGPWLLALWGGGRIAYQRVGWVLAGITLATGLYCFFAVASARFHTRASGPRPAFRVQLSQALANRPLLRLIVIKCVTFFALAVSSSVLPYFVRYVLHASDAWTGTYIIVGSIASVASIPLWLWCARRIDKRFLAIAAYSAYGLACGSWIFATAGDAAFAMIARTAVAGVGAAGSVLFLRSMFTDTIAYDYLRTGLRREGAFTGLFSLVEKGFSALGLAFVGTALGAGGYIASVDNGVTEQPARVVLAIRVLFALLPAIGSTVATLVLLNYRLYAATLERLRRENAGVRSARGSEPS